MRGFRLLRMVFAFPNFLLPPLSSLINIVGVARGRSKVSRFCDTSLRAGKLSFIKNYL